MYFFIALGILKIPSPGICEILKTLPSASSFLQNSERKGLGLISTSKKPFLSEDDNKCAEAIKPIPDPKKCGQYIFL